MTPTNVVAIVAVGVSCATALLVGYWHRKQLRQIELFRKDPSVGILPPPSEAAAFLGRHFTLIVGVFLPTCALLLLLTTWPLTRTSVVLLIANLVSVFISLLARTEQRLLELQRNQSEVARDMINLLKDLHTEISTLQQRVSTLELSGIETQRH
jgi:hypothetical protein